METLKTVRLILRSWTLTDAESVYEQARNPKIGAMCGWPPHTSVEESREIIEHVLRFPAWRKAAKLLNTSSASRIVLPFAWKIIKR